MRQRSFGDDGGGCLTGEAKVIVGAWYSCVKVYLGVYWLYGTTSDGNCVRVQPWRQRKLTNSKMLKVWKREQEPKPAREEEG